MELDLQRTILESYQPVLDTTITQEETLESIVPDAFPDISRVIRASGNAFLTAKQVIDGSVKLLGNALLTVLYVSDEESVPRAVTYSMPFQCMTDCPLVNENSQVHCSVISAQTDARPMNPRKLFLKTEIKIQVMAYNRESREIVCDVAKEDPETLQKQMKQHIDYAMVSVLEKPFQFSDILHQSSSKPAIEEVLQWHAEPGSVEAKYIGKKLICKGEVLLSILYRSGSELHASRFELPLSQIIEIEGNFQEGDPSSAIVLKKVECTLHDGDIEVTVDAVVHAMLWTQRNVTLLCDLYSTTAPLDVSRTLSTVCVLSERSSNRVPGRKFCESGIPAKQVISTNTVLSPLSPESIGNDIRFNSVANVDVLYMSEDNAVCNVSYSVPVQCEVPLSNHAACSCACRLIGEATAVPVTGGFEIRLEAEFAWHTTKQESVPVVCQVKKAIRVNEGAPKPSVIIRMVSEGESLWDVAKSCNSTVRDICAANELSSETAMAGVVLLIPTKR